MKIRLKIFPIIFLIVNSFASFSQTMVNKETVLKQTLQFSKLIVEGKIISPGKSFRAKNNAIYTEYDVQVEKVLSGNVSTQTIKLLVEGGNIIENGMTIGTGTPHGIDLRFNTISTIFAQPTDIGTSPESFMAIEQVCYHVNNQIIATNHLSEYYTDINDLYSDISKKLGIKILEKKRRCKRSK